MRKTSLLLGLALTSALALLAVVSAADADAARGGSSAVSELSGYGAAGARYAAASAFDRGEVERSARIARTTVLRAPIERGGTSLLGLARLRAGDTAGGIAAMRAALMLGWRDPLTQAWALEASIENADFDNAALRLDALARMNPRLDNLSPAFEVVERTKEGQTAILNRARLRPAWVEGYLQSADRATDAGITNRVSMILAAAELVGATDPVATSSAVWAMHRRDQPAAYSLWRILKGDIDGSKRPQTNLPPIGSAISTSSKTPFDWWIAEDGPLVSPSQSDAGLLLETERPGQQLALFINTALATGRQYRLVLDGRGANAKAVVDVRCAISPDQLSLLSAVSGKGMEFTVPEACPTQVITVSLVGGPGSYEIRTLSLIMESGRS